MTGRSPLVNRFDRLFTRLLRLGGRLAGRPDEEMLHELTGRSKGGAAGGTDSSAYLRHLEQGRRDLQAGDFGEALHQFKRASEARSQEPWPWHGRGDVLQLTGDHAAALVAYDEALARAPLALAHNGRGNALECLGRLEEAREAWRAALDLDPRLSWPRNSLERTE